MKEKIEEICNKLNREQLSVHGATEELLNLFSVIGCASDIKYFTKFIKDSTVRMTSGNYMHRKDGIAHAADQINKVVDDAQHCL